MEKYLDYINLKDILVCNDNAFNIDKVYDDKNIPDHHLRFAEQRKDIPLVIIKNLGNGYYKLISGERLLLAYKMYKSAQILAIVVSEKINDLDICKIALYEHLKTINKNNKELILQTQFRLLSIYIQKFLGLNEVEINCDILYRLGVRFYNESSYLMDLGNNALYLPNPCKNAKIAQAIANFLFEINISHDSFKRRFKRFNRLKHIR